LLIYQLETDLLFLISSQFHLKAFLYKKTFFDDKIEYIKKDTKIYKLYKTNNLMKKDVNNETKKSKNSELTIILPCRNEQEALPFCLNQIKNILDKHKINAEIIISDFSTDNSYKIAKEFATENPELNLKIIKHNKDGYGNAYLEAFKHISNFSNYIFMADCDGSYDFNEIPNFLKELKQGNDFVIGDRFSRKLEPEVMPLTNKTGNFLLSGLLRLFYKTKIKDCHCGMRALTNQSLKKLNLQTTGMEFASEMIIKALKNNLKIKQLPISYKKRIGRSKLKAFSDGWRHLRFMLLYSPLFLFFVPGFFLFLLGILSLLWFYFTNPKIFGITFYTHPMFLSSLLVIIGYQLIIFSLFAKTYAITHLQEKSYLEKFYKYITIEKAIIFGFFLSLIGLIVFITIFIKWLSSGFGSLNETKASILALTLIVLGIQTIFSSFMLSILGIKER